MLSIKKQLAERAKLKEYMKGVNSFEIYVGDYKYNEYDGCRYKVILGNAEFSGCENLNLDNLQYVSGVLDVNDSHNINFALSGVGKGVILSNNHKLNFKNLSEVNGDFVISDTFIDDISNIQAVNGVVCFNHSKIFVGSPYINRRIGPIFDLDKGNEL